MSDPISDESLKAILFALFPKINDDNDVLEYFLSMFKESNEILNEEYLIENVAPFLESYDLSSDPIESCKQLCKRLNDIGVKQKIDDTPKLLEKSIILSEMNKNLLSTTDSETIDTLWGFEAIRKKKNDVFEATEAGSAKYERKAAKEQKKFLENLETQVDNIENEDENIQISSMTLPDFSGNNKEKDIHVSNFNITFGGSVLLDGADLRIVYGRRYGLVGKNGIGNTAH